MTKNMGMVDRVIRAVIGALFLAWAFGKIGPVTSYSWIGWVLGLLMLGTSAMGMCPPYKLLGINTCGLPRDTKQG